MFSPIEIEKKVFENEIIPSKDVDQSPVMVVTEHKVLEVDTENRARPRNNFDLFNPVTSEKVLENETIPSSDVDQSPVVSDSES